jgi:hypothetical protein
MPQLLITPTPRPPLPDDALNARIVAVVHDLLRLEPGPLAALRRTSPGAGCAAFWRVYHRASLAESPRPASADWEHALHALALLIPTGRDQTKASPHDARTALGSALFEAGVSHERLARLIATPFAARREALARLARRLAREERPFDVRHLARLMLRDSRGDLRLLASAYYGAEAAAEHSEKEKADG